MTQGIAGAVLILVLGMSYVRLSRNVTLKRWMLPVATAGLAALLGLAVAAMYGGTLAAHAVGIPLGMSAGLMLQHLLDYCRRCGATQPLSLSLTRLAPHSPGHVPCKACKAALRALR